MAFIIDRYNKYNVWDREHSRKAFEINENWYAVYEVELEWGLPQLQYSIERDQEEEAKNMKVYDTFEDAMRFVQLMKGLN